MRGQGEGQNLPVGRRAEGDGREVGDSVAEEVVGVPMRRHRRHRPPLPLAAHHWTGRWRSGMIDSTGMVCWCSVPVHVATCVLHIRECGRGLIGV